MNPTDYSLDCECGRTLPVAKTQAGSEIVCFCGRSLRVPRLSELRRSQGQDPLETGVRDTIARLIRQGQLPSGECCAVSQFPTTDVMQFDVICERSYTKGGKRWGIFLLIMGLFMPCWWIFALLGWSLASERTERVGRDVVLTVPLRVAQQHQPGLRRWARQRRLRSLLSTVPEYERLLSEYPGAQIIPR